MKIDKSIANITKFNLILAYLSIVMYAFIRIYNNFIVFAPAKGDEESFLSAFKYYLSQGFYEANVEGNSTIFNLISSFFYTFTSNDLLSLRLTSILFGVLTFIILWKLQKKFFILTNSFFHLAFVTALNVVVVKSFVFFGINDTIIVFLTVAFFYILFKIKTDSQIKHFYFLLLGLILSSFMATRLMSIIIFPSIILVIILVLKKSNRLKFDKNNGILLVSFVVFLTLFNVPSLIEKGKLSFHQKSTGFKGLTWVQFQYLSAIEQEKGTIKHNAHVSWEDVNEYVKTHGENSLPKTNTEALLFDMKRTVKEFFKDLFLLIKPFTRLLGILFLISIPVFLIKIITEKSFLVKVLTNEIFLFFISYTFIICFIVISNVEIRWLTNILILLPVLLLSSLSKVIAKQKNKKSINFVLINTQLIALLIFNLAFIFKTIVI